MEYTLLVLFSFLITMFSSSAHAQSSPAPNDHPNLIIIYVDDMGYGDIEPLRLQAQPHARPAIGMAAEGMKLTSFYAAPVCTPSRAQMLTGCYAKRVSLPQVIFPAAKVGLSGEEHTIADLLKQQGYATECIGKWHVGDQPEFLPTHRGFDHYLGLPYSNDMGGEWDGAGGCAATTSASRRCRWCGMRKSFETLNGDKQNADRIALHR